MRTDAIVVRDFEGRCTVIAGVGRRVPDEGYPEDNALSAGYTGSASVFEPDRGAPGTDQWYVKNSDIQGVGLQLDL